MTETLIAIFLFAIILILFSTTSPSRTTHDPDRLYATMDKSSSNSHDPCKHREALVPILFGKVVEPTKENLSSEHTLMMCPVCFEEKKADE